MDRLEDGSIDPDVSRLQPLLSLGINMNIKEHSVGSFRERLEELERGILTLNYLGQPAPERKQTKKLKSSTEKVADYYEQLAPRKASNPGNPMQGLSNVTGAAGNPMQGASSSTSRTSVFIKKKKIFRSKDMIHLNNVPDTCDDVAFYKFLHQAQLDSRYCIDDKDVLGASVDQLSETGGKNMHIEVGDEVEDRLIFITSLGFRGRK